MPSYDFEIISSRAFAVEMYFLLKELGGALIVDITEVQEAPATYVSMKITLTDKGKCATDTGLDVPLTTESASLPESGWDVSKPLNPIVHRISGSAKN